MKVEIDNVFIGDAYIDFYVDRKKFNSYKSESGQMNYVHRELDKIFKSLVGEVCSARENEPQIDLFPKVTIRDVSITSNNFWGEKYIQINDLGYSGTNELEPIDESLNKLPLRFLMVDIIGVVEKALFKSDYFIKITKPNFIISVSTYKLV